MRQPKAVKQFADPGAMCGDALLLAQLDHQRVQCKLALLGNARAHPVRDIVQLATARSSRLSRLKTTGLIPQFHQIVHELRRDTKVQRHRTMTMTFINHRRDTHA